MELELRLSDFATFSSRSLLDATFLEICFDNDNIMDLLLTRDLSETSQFEL